MGGGGEKTKIIFIFHRHNEMAEISHLTYIQYNSYSLAEPRKNLMKMLFVYQDGTVSA